MKELYKIMDMKKIFGMNTLLSMIAYIAASKKKN